MRTGVITFHSAHNFGATLQTWALQKTLKKLGMEPSVIHYHPESIDKLYEVPPMDTWKKRWQYLTRSAVRKRRKKLKQRYHRYQQFIKEQLVLTGDYHTWEELQANPPGLDCYITGSDQVWNSDHTNGYDPAYLLEFAEPGSRKIAYAASVGREDFPVQYRERYAKAIRSFDAVSVREKSAAEAVSNAFGKPAAVVLDPTLLLERQEYDEIKIPSKRSERYILVYMMENNRSLIRLANSISVVTGLPVIQRKPGRLFKNEIDSFFTHTPGEFLGELEGADYVITNSFHGTVFSILYKKPFISMLHSETGSRTIDLLEGLGLSSHILEDAKDFKDMGQFSIEDPWQLQRKLEELRQESMHFLRQALNIEREYEPSLIWREEQ